MFEEDREAVFLDKLQEYEGLIRFASKRYQIPGILDCEDLYQEGCMILNKMLQDDYAYPLDPYSRDFRKMFKTELWHRLGHCTHKQKARKRDYRKVAFKDFGDIDPTPVNDSSARDTFTNEELDSFSSGLSPEELYEAIEHQCDVEEFLDNLIESLDDEAQIVLSELLFPTPWEEIPDSCKLKSDFTVRVRNPKKKIPQSVLAEMLDWPLVRVRRAITRIRRTAIIIAENKGLKVLASATKGRPKTKRKKNGKESSTKGVPSRPILQSGADRSSRRIGTNYRRSRVATVLAS